MLLICKDNHKKDQDSKLTRYKVGSTEKVYRAGRGLNLWRSTQNRPGVDALANEPCSTTMSKHGGH